MTPSTAARSAASARLPYLLSRPESVKPLWTTYEHQQAGSSAEVAFVPARNPPTDGRRRAVYVFLPGNPGLVRYYDAFLSSLADDDALPSHVDLLAVGHLGHGPSLPAPEDVEALDLEAQVAAKLELLDDIWEVLGRDAEIVVGGHSVGCWMAVEVLKRRPQVRALALMFPTLSHIANTPNGRMLWPIFRPLSIPLLGSTSYLFRLAPTRLLNLLAPPPTISLVRSSHVIRSALILGRSEMATIREADLEFLAAQRDKIWAYFGRNDGWVDDNEASKIMEILRADGVLSSSSGGGSVQRVWHCVESLPHAFCLAHGEIMATKCGAWLSDAFSADDRQTK